MEAALRRDLSSLVDGLGAIVSHLAPNVDFAVRSLLSLSEVVEVPQVYAAEVFDRIFSDYKSDKSTTHSYQEAYPYILSMIGDVRKVLEIGIGARQPSPDSPEGWEGQAGGSLHAWSQITGGAQVLGLDIDPRMDEAVPNVATRHMDSLDADSVKSTAREVLEGEGEFDLIVDDGLHVPMANITNFLYFFPLVRPGGFYVVEDLHRSSLVAVCHVARLKGVREAFEYSRRSDGYGDDNALIAIRKA